MAHKPALFALALLVTATTSSAAPIRPLNTKENRFPELRHAEVNVVGRFTEITDPGETFSNSETNVYTAALNLRYRLFEELTLVGTVPYEDVDSDFGPGASGLGDVEVGFEFLAYQDIFDYPWIIPHLTAHLDTGDSDEGIGEGESSVDIGLALGSKAWEVCHFIADVRYRVYEDSENIVSVAGAVIWDISDQFSVLGEFKVADEDEDDGNGNPVMVLGGMSYQATETLAFTVNGGGGKNTREDVLVNLKATLSL